jgi:hypothetical protein
MAITGSKALFSDIAMFVLIGLKLSWDHSGRSLVQLGLGGYVQLFAVLKMYQDNPNPTHSLTDSEVFGWNAICT